MTKKERKKAIEVLDDMKVKIDIPKAAKTQNDRNWALDLAIQVLSQEPCDDAISREELLKAIDTWDKFGYTETGCFVRITKEIDNYVPYVHLEDVITAIQKLPPVTQKCEKCAMNGSGSKYCDNCGQKSGKWIPVSERLPKIADVYRVTRYYQNNVMNPKYIVDACAFDGSNTWYNDNRINHERAYVDNIIAWQENPKPYEPQESEDKE